MKNYPRLSLYLGVTGISFAAIFVKWVSVNAATSAFYRTFYGSLCLVIFILIDQTKSQKKFPKEILNIKFLQLSISAGVLFGLDLFIWHKSIHIIGASMASLVANTQIFFAAGLMFLIYKEKLSKEYFFILPIAFIGLILLMFKTNKVEIDQLFILGILYSLLAGLMYAGFIVINKITRKQYSHLNPIYTWCLASCITCISIYFLAQLDNGIETQISAQDHLLLFLLGLIVHAISWILISYSMAKLPVMQTSFSLMGQPLLAAIWGYLFFSESLTSTQTIGMLITFCMILMANYVQLKKT